VAFTDKLGGVVLLLLLADQQNWISLLLFLECWMLLLWSEASS